ncbi:hypothetical protein OnM2_091018 [Erysiphe neolycopersici]|uniref:Uncharacterized protein n=1 Tax=Erysiphe neolycopersici TaxID=212602 RepID=A0A420HCQ3_9PEZI|nr:hypothetical protein OnM2_091018 [Erysiphe neolycopersici]
MSRITPPVTRIVQISRKVSAGRSITGQSNSFRRANVAIYGCGLKDIKMESMNNNLMDLPPNADLIGSQATQGLHTIHRPTVSSKYKVIPLMQGFQNSAPKHAFHGLSTIDSQMMPSLKIPPPPPAKLRVPLLPDNYAPDRCSKSSHSLETSDDIFPKPEISIVAYHSEFGSPAPIGEAAELDPPLKESSFLQ